MTLLKLIQTNILLDCNKQYCKFSKENHSKKNFLKKYEFIDNSIEIHICSSIQMEVQILHDNLLRILNNNSNIFPHDIIIKSTNLKIYSPFIKNIFNNVEKKLYIPFFIVNQKIDTNNLIFNSFFKLLNLPKSNFFHEEIFSLLKLPFIHKKFLLNEKEVTYLKKWTQKSNIRWAIDGNHLKKNKIPIDIHNTWEKGLKRIIISCSINSEENVLWNKIPSSCNLYSNASNILNKFLIFISFLKKWKSKLSTLKKIKNWKSIGKNIIDDFYVKTERTKNYLKIILISWKKTITSALTIKNYKISIFLLIEEVLKNINSYKIQKNMFVGSVIISNLDCFEYIPYKFTYLLGIDEKNYPKSKNYDFYDLTNLENNAIYFDNHELKKYSFLVNLTNTKNFFFISYIKSNNIYTNKTFLSPFVIELKNYIKKITNKIYNSFNYTKVKKKVFDVKYNHESTVFDQTNFQKKSIFQTFSKQWLKVSDNYYNNQLNRKNFYNSISFFDKKYILIENFIFFWKNPIHYFFKHYCNITISKNYINISNFEPFSIDYLNQYKLNKEMFDYKLKNKKNKFILEKYTTSGKLPYKHFGKIWFSNQEKEIENIFKKMSFLTLNSFENINFDLKLNGIFLKGKINVFKEEIYHKFGFFYFKPSVLNIKDGISFWIQHLIYCSLGGKKPSILLGTKNSKWEISPLTVEKANYYLKKYMNGFVLGSKKPILLTCSGMYWLNTIFDKKIKKISKDKFILKKGKEKFIKIWNGDQFRKGEKDDIFLKKIVLTLNTKNTKKIFNNAKKWFFPILKYSYTKTNIS